MIDLAPVCRVPHEADFLLGWIAPSFFCRGAFGRNMISENRQRRYVVLVQSTGHRKGAAARWGRARDVGGAREDGERRKKRHRTQGTQPPGPRGFGFLVYSWAILNFHFSRAWQ